MVFKLRVLGTLGGIRLAGSVILLGLVPIADRVDAVVTIGATAGVFWALIGIEAVRHAEARRDIRRAEHLRHAGD